MMRLMLGLVLTLLVVPGATYAVRDCPSCLLSLWDNPAMTQSFGTITPFTPKQFYLGIKFGAGETRLSGIEFSISGWDPDVLWLQLAESVTSPAATLMLNSPMAPADTTQMGGMNVAWPSCIVGSQVLLRFTVVWMNPVPPTSLVLHVGHRYYPTNPDYGIAGPVFTNCDDPSFPAVRASGGSYVLNPVVHVDSSTWGVVKGLYR